MLKNYFEVDENLNMQGFLKEIKEKKNSHYIILNTNPKSFVDVRTIALKVTNLNEKLKGLKKTLSESKGKNTNEHINFLIESGDRVIKIGDLYYSFIDALLDISNQDLDFLNEKNESIEKREIYALNKNDKVSSARNLFLQKRVNLLPVIEGLKISGELRPIDLLVTDLFEVDNEKGNYYNKKNQENILNSNIENLINTRPLTLNKNQKISDALKLMISKKLPSIIITDEEGLLYSILSYKDIFKLYQKTNELSKFKLEYVGSQSLYDDDFDLIQDYAEKTMKKISNISKYDTLKLSFKTIGDKDAGHKTRIQVKMLLSEGNKIIQVEKEISTGTSDEEFNDKIKGKWNIPQMIQETLNALEKRVKEEKSKNN
ncbi:MAG: CBS domain-containing protein [Candidatus Woesearchaeota archaeon]|jgi:CBS domain-containing protein|nr:CBS domain-containing protein [Candidatus Woesearchaeota archaeon]